VLENVTAANLGRLTGARCWRSSGR